MDEYKGLARQNKHAELWQPEADDFDIDDPMVYLIGIGRMKLSSILASIQDKVTILSFQAKNKNMTILYHSLLEKKGTLLHYLAGYREADEDLKLIKDGVNIHYQHQDKL